MKKFLLFAAAVLAFASCEKPAQDTPEPGTDPTEDVISINPKEKAFGNGGGSVDVKVTSSADWTLTSGNEYSWVTVFLQNRARTEQLSSSMSRQTRLSRSRKQSSHSLAARPLQLST